MKSAVIAAAVLLFVLPMSAQEAGSVAQPQVAAVVAALSAPAGQARRRAPQRPAGFAEGAMAFPVGRFRAQLAGLIPRAKAQGQAVAMLRDFGTYKLMLSVRGRSGGAEIHAHWDDVMIVEQGDAMLVTGGRVVDGRTIGDGETLGLRIEGGRRQSIGAGDIVTVRAGTPHQLLLDPGTVFSTFVIQVHEP